MAIGSINRDRKIFFVICNENFNDLKIETRRLKFNHFRVLLPSFRNAQHKPQDEPLNQMCVILFLRNNFRSALIQDAFCRVLKPQ